MNSPTAVRAKLRAHGRYPKFVYRAFKQKSHADNFALSGKFRMGNIRVYTDIEDGNRQDSSEGQGQFQQWGMVTTVDFVRGSDKTFTTQSPGYVQTDMELLNPKFVLCCSQRNVDLAHLRRFGPWLVKIEQPRQFAQEVSDYLATLPYRFSGGVEGCVVYYNKGDKIRPTLTDDASVRMSYAQKPAAFKADKEFRFVVIVNGPPSSCFDDDYLTIDLGRALGYVTII